MSKLNRNDYGYFEDLMKEEQNLKQTYFFGSDKLGERHIAEFRMWLTGASYKKIGLHFNISACQAETDIKKAARIAEFHHKSKEEQERIINNLYPVNHYGRLRVYLTELAERNNFPKNLVVRATNAFARVVKGYNPDYLDALKNADPESFIKLRNIGTKSVEILHIAHQELNKSDKDL